MWIKSSSSGSSCTNVFTSFVSSHLTKTLPLLVLLTGLVSCNQTSTTPPSVAGVLYYFIDITVDVTGPTKNESEITSWLQQVFQTKLESCISPYDEHNSTATPTALPTTSANGTTTLSQGHSSSSPTKNVTQSTSATTLQTSNTTEAATTTMQSNNTTIQNNTTVTTIQSNTTIPPTAIQNTTTTIIQNNTTATTIQSSTTIPLTTIQNTTTTITIIQNNTTATTIQSNTTIPPTAIQNTTTTITIIQNNTTAATSTVQNTNTTAATTSLQSNTIVATTTIHNNTTAATTPLQNIDTASVTASRATTSRAITDDAGRSMTTSTSLIAANDGGKNTGILNTSPSNRARFIRDVQSSTSSGLFQGLEVSCAKKTQIRKTNCLVTLAVKQDVLPCCILKTLCTAKENSSDIHIEAKRANRLTPLGDNCSRDHLEENICLYNSTNSTCQDSEFRAPPCGSDMNKHCSCLSYCNGTDAYYTLEISIKDPEMNLSYPLLLISQLNQSCSPTENVSCPLSTIASEYKNTSLDCGQAAADPQICRVIIHLAQEVPICNVSAAVTAVFQSQENITFDGLTTRAAICGHSNASENPLDSQLTWMNTNLQHADFCTAYFFTDECQAGHNVVVELKDQCVPTMSSTATPDVTTTQPNITSTSTPSPPVDTTTASPGTSSNDTESQASALLELTSDVSRLNASQVDQLVSQLEDLLSGPNVSVTLANISIHIVSNLLGASAETLAQSSNRIIKIVETVGFKVVLEGESQTLLAPAVALSAKAVDGSNFQEVFFSISDPSNVQVRGDSRLRRNVKNDSSVPQGSITLPPSLTQNLTLEEQQLASRVHFNFYQKSTVFQDRSLGTRRLISGILGASVANMTVTGLQEDVVIRLKNTEPVPANYVASCVFWDFALNDRSGGWNSNGCRVQNSSDDVTVCGCNHLTSFAILLDLARQPLTSRVQATILTFITYIGCGVSAIFLSLTLLTYLAFGKLRKDVPSKILIQLCLALLLLNLVFLVDAWLALYPDATGLCISTAWFLHYFLLVAFTWMGLEAMHMYLAIIKVFNSYISHYMLRFSVVGWGVPMIVVIIVIAVDKDNYGLVSYGRFSDGTTDDFCWLRNDIAFYVAVVAYFCVIFLFNFIMFLAVLVQVCRMKRQNPHNSHHRTTGQDLRSVVGITFLLGLTWGFAFFAWGPVNLPFMYLFAICNSFQGFFIFVFHCAVKDVVRRQWQMYLCCGKMRLAENSEWSRTATQKTGKRVPSRPSSSQSSTSSFLGHNSDLTQGIGSPLDDRIITADEEHRADVILNRNQLE
uniref:serine-rich adhesin for platelets n=1 Tax=Doryrhamphus excisus TaxID=161450 RepID=UPI0025AE34EB|nr:serine-rich adhesin for platelets [Doryrhamphus excisus]XP_057942710.1 serine-rich adhesin for platelets [Doryrhamphus excisus]